MFIIFCVYIPEINVFDVYRNEGDLDERLLSLNNSQNATVSTSHAVSKVFRNFNDFQRSSVCNEQFMLF